MKSVVGAVTQPSPSWQRGHCRARSAAPQPQQRVAVRVQAAAVPFLGPDPRDGGAADSAAGAAPEQQQQEAAEADEALAYDTQHVPTGNDKVRHMPTSLYSKFPKLPPDGSTLLPEEAKRDPDSDRFQAPIHVWEARCSACSGTGHARSYSRSRDRRGSLGVCMLCHGLGYVRHSSSRAHTVPYVNGTGPNTTVGRPPPPSPPPPETSAKLFGWLGIIGKGPSGGKDHPSGQKE